MGIWHLWGVGPRGNYRYIGVIYTDRYLTRLLSFWRKRNRGKGNQTTFWILGSKKEFEGACKPSPYYREREWAYWHWHYVLTVTLRMCHRDLGVVSLHSLVNTGVSSQRSPKKKIRPKWAKKNFFGQKFFFSNLIIVEYFKKKKCI